MTRMKSGNGSSDSDELVVDLPKLQRNTGVPAEISSEWKPDSVRATHSNAILMQVEISLEAVSDRVTALGTAILHWTAQCRRCLEATSGSTSIDINEIFEKGASEGETFELPLGEKLDLRPMLAEQAMLNLPVAALCSKSCTGPIDTEFLTNSSPSNTGENPEEFKDPRWDVLDQLKFSDD